MKFNYNLDPKYKEIKLRLWDASTGFNANLIQDDATRIVVSSDPSKEFVLEINDKYVYKMCNDGKIEEYGKKQ